MLRSTKLKIMLKNEVASYPPFLSCSLAYTGTPIVVQLFNAVSKQQKELKSRLEEAGPSERKRAKGLCVLCILSGA